MITIQDLSSIIDNNILEDLFIQRYELISSLSIKDKENLKPCYDKRAQTREKLNISIDNLPDCLKEAKEQIKENIENHIETSREADAYFEEKLYKAGVIDGINLILKSRG